MKSSRDAVLQKFTRLRPAGEEMRRADYKGQRRRLNLRAEEELLDQLQLIKIASKEAKNTYCLRILKVKVAETLKELQQKHDPAEWQVLVRLSKGNGR